MKKIKSILRSCLIIVFVFGVITVAQASETDGAIIVDNPNAGYAWSDQIGWVNFGITGGNIHITDSGITGNAWNSNKGWINMAPTNGGVTVAANGALSGYAWSTNAGWVNFSGASINSSGKFTGSASGTIIGTLSFDCNNCDVRTDFRPQNFRTTIPPPSGGGGGGGIIYTPPTPPEGGFRALINDNAEETNFLTVTLRLFGGPNTVRMAISERADFSDAGQEPYQEIKSWTFIGGEGTKTIYVKFYTSSGGASETISDSIIYKILSVPGETPTPSIPESEEGLPGTFISPRPGEPITPASGETETQGEAEDVSQPEISEELSQEGEISEEPSEESIPEQLFDINLELDRDKIRSIDELIARVIFVSFGKVPTPVDMTFDILDTSGAVIHSEKDMTTVETEKIFTKYFTGAALAAGTYTLRLTTLYNTNARDTFETPFSIISEGASAGWLAWLIRVFLFALFGILFLIWWKRRHTCSVCKHYYKDTKWEKRCEDWCKTHSSYNSQIASHAKNK